MGSGIAQVAAQAGYDVVLHDTSPEAVDRAMTAIAASQQRFVAKGSLSEEDAEAARARIVTTTDLERHRKRADRRRGRFRESRVEAADLRRARPPCRPRRDPCDEHHRDSDHEDRGRYSATRPRCRHALLLAGPDDGAVRTRPRRRDLRRHAGPRAVIRRSARQDVCGRRTRHRRVRDVAAPDRLRQRGDRARRGRTWRRRPTSTPRAASGSDT